MPTVSYFGFENWLVKSRPPVPAPLEEMLRCRLSARDKLFSLSPGNSLGAASVHTTQHHQWQHQQTWDCKRGETECRASAFDLPRAIGHTSAGEIFKLDQPNLKAKMAYWLTLG
jgi:hypothetical protein